MAVASACCEALAGFSCESELLPRSEFVDAVRDPGPGRVRAGDEGAKGVIPIPAPRNTERWPAPLGGRDEDEGGSELLAGVLGVLLGARRVVMPKNPHVTRDQRWG